MKQDQHKTKVIFRIMKDPDYFDNPGESVVAIFPEIPGDSNPYRTCLSYQHVGQHGAISLDYPEFTFPATDEESKDLQRELESLGYNLKVCKRMQYNYLRIRLQECMSKD